MSLQVTFETIEDIKRFRNNLQILKLQLLQFQAVTTRKLGVTITLHTIHAKMRAAGFSQKIIDGTILDEIDILGPKKVRYHFRSVYFSSTGFDVAVGREEGTKTHFIEPLSNLSPFIDKPEALHFDETKFSKGHEVSGIVALFIVANTVRETAENVRDEYRRQLLNWYVANLGGVAVAN